MIHVLHLTYIPCCSLKKTNHSASTCIGCSESQTQAFEVVYVGGLRERSWEILREKGMRSGQGDRP